jgi:Sec-independent protein secretion pathway component TatC
MRLGIAAHKPTDAPMAMSAALSTARRPDDDRDAEAGGTMSFLDHLEDLRKRIIYSCIALGVGMAVSFGYAVLIILVTAVVLTPSPDPWNMAIFAAPMFCLYAIGIGVAWVAEPRRRSNSSALRLVFTAAVLDRAWKHHAAPRLHRR